MRIIEPLSAVATVGGIGAVVAAQSTTISNGATGDITINAVLLLGLFFTIIGALVSTITFLYRQQSSAYGKITDTLHNAHDDEVARIREGYEALIKSKNETIASLELVNDRFNGRIEALRAMLNEKESQTFTLATGAIQASNSTNERLVERVEELGREFASIVDQGQRHHERQVAILTLISHKLGAMISTAEGIEDENSRPDISVWTSPVPPKRA